jgi:hypothetical protein
MNRSDQPGNERLAMGGTHQSAERRSSTSCGRCGAHQVEWLHDQQKGFLTPVGDPNGRPSKRRYLVGVTPESIASTSSVVFTSAKIRAMVFSSASWVSRLTSATASFTRIMR